VQTIIWYREIFGMNKVNDKVNDSEEEIYKSLIPIHILIGIKVDKVLVKHSSLHNDYLRSNIAHFDKTSKSGDGGYSGGISSILIISFN
jgi:hypothetical protein